MSNHTPGPWLAKKSMVPNLYGSRDVWDGDYKIISGNKTVAVVMYYDVTEKTKANARLIAAAPELLKALKVIAVWANNPSNNGADYGHIHALSMEAIAKAKGETE